MKILELPHRLADYLCPVNGLADIYEWKRKSRIPDELLFYCQLGFMDVVNRNACPPRMVFLGCTIGKRQYIFWQDIMGYKLYHSEGKAFATALAEVKELIDRNIPAILFGLDMYHLPYHEKFYHKVHIPGHIVLMAGYDDGHVYVQDNSKTGLQAVPFGDLKLAWAQGFAGLAAKNATYGIEFYDTAADDRAVVQSGLESMAWRYLAPPVGFMGAKGLSRLIKSFPSWANAYDADTIKAIYTHMVTFTGSVLPMPPEELDPSGAGFHNPHRGCRDRMAKALRAYAGQYGDGKWLEAADRFEESGAVIQRITDSMVRDILSGNFSDTAKYAELFASMRTCEENAHRCFLKAP
jgi:hypothetical protein